MAKITFADVVHQSISFSDTDPGESLILKLIDTPWVQRLRDISQTANTRLVYMFSEHSRFGHCLGVAYLASRLVDSLIQKYPEAVEFKPAICAAALLHDIGHLAPGSHIAQKCWFPDVSDQHESIAIKIIAEDTTLRNLLNKNDPDLADRVSAILCESDSLPPWVWQIISGGGWNVDRGNWCIVDSILAGVSYGQYNIPALTDSIIITSSGELGLTENRLDAMMHFAVSRHAMYRQVYQHRVLLAADQIVKTLVKRARDLGDTLEFADPTMKAVLRAKHPKELSLEQIFWLREGWWRYHLQQWSASSDSILSDLADRVLHRRLFKTIRLRTTDDEITLVAAARAAAQKAGLDPEYYVHVASAMDVHTSDSAQSLQVALDDGSVRTVGESDPLFQALVQEEAAYRKRWMALPEEVKITLGRSR